MTDLATAIDLLDRFVAFPTVTDDSNLDMVACLAGRLEDAGARVEVMPDADGRRANVFATLGPERDGGIVLSGHTDVVPPGDAGWTGDPFAMRRDGDRLLGRGTCDMKGFLACAVAAAPLLAEAARRRPVHFAFTYDEEVGCHGARALVAALEERGLRPGLAIVGEPTGMQVIDGHKGCFEYTTRFTGLEGHGSNPDAGVNAVEYAARFAARLMSLRDRLRARAPERPRFDPPWTTLNIGRVTGGTGHNVIAGRARVEWEMRPVQPGDAEFVKAELAAYCAHDLLPAMRAVGPDAGIATEIVAEIAGLVPMPENAARDLACALTGRNDVGTVAFGTEAGLFQALGMAVVVCGPGHIAQAHRPDEYVAAEQLRQCMAMLARLPARLTG